MNEKDLTDDYIEGLLRDHFKAEVAELPATRHPWDWLMTRLESPSIRPGSGGLLDILHGFMKAMPKPLVAGIAVLVVLAGVTMLVPVAQPIGHLDFREEAADVPQSGPDLPGNPGISGAPGPPHAAPPSATNFKDYERSWLASTVEDNVSTFSLDADRTSFQLALNWARSGLTVDPDSVRAEEWINAFGYGYNPPVHQDSFAITTDVFRHPLNSGMHMVRLGFQAPELQDDAPLNVTLVLDASGSMSDGNRVAIAREAAESIRRSLGSRDRIGVVQFTTDVIHELTVEHSAPDDRAVRRSIEKTCS